MKQRPAQREGRALCEPPAVQETQTYLKYALDSE